jgi:cytidine deaminase
MINFSILRSSSRRVKSIGGKKLAIGQSYHIKNAAMLSIHAEHNAINKFIKINKYRRFVEPHEKIDIVVIRLSKSGAVGYSRPCRNCLLRMLNCELRINNIYYTSADGSIKVEKLSQMFNSELTVMSRGDSRKMLKMIDKN